MKKYIITLGLNDKDKKIQLINTLEAYKIINNLLMEKTNGFSIYEMKGGYRHDNGVFTFETSLKIELMFIEKLEVINIIRLLKSLFNQETVVLQVENITSELI